MSIWSVIGSRCLPSSWESRVGDVVDLLLSRGHRICSGGAVGADLAALRSLVRHGASACQGSSVCLPGDLLLAPPSYVPWLSRFAALGGEIVEGSASARSSRQEVSHESSQYHQDLASLRFLHDFERAFRLITR